MSTTLAPKFISVPYGIIMSTSAHEILSGKSKYYMIDFIMADQKLMDKVDTIITERGIYYRLDLFINFLYLSLALKDLVCFLGLEHMSTISVEILATIS